MKQLITKLSLGLTGGVLTVAALAGASASAMDQPLVGLDRTIPGTCTSTILPVALGDGQSADQQVAVTLCAPKYKAQGQPQVDVLTAGATYNSSYWNWPQNPDLYSYVNKTLDAGRATLAYDRIGSGNSSRPASGSITMASDAYVLHELVQGLHAIGYPQVNSVGHSYGSGIAMHEAATYQDVSRLVLTGYLHAGRNPIVGSATYPAANDPLFAGQQNLAGYLTTTPATDTAPSGRQAAFYSSAADPSVIAYDDAHKDLVSLTGFLSYLGDRAVPAGGNLSNQVTAPTLLIIGDQDQTGCFDASIGGLDCSDPASVQAHEAAYYTGAASFSFDEVANTGHDLALHPSANDSFQMIDGWIQSH